LDLSPDNKRLVFATELRHKGKINILTIPVSGGSPTELYESQESEGGILVPRQLTWTPDGNYILFAKNEKKGSSVCRLSSAGGDPEVIWNSENRVSGLSVHHNGKQIVVSTFLQEQTIWVMENFLPEN